MSARDASLQQALVEAIRHDVQFKLRELIQDALKFTRHSKRPFLSVSAVAQALRMRGQEPLYGAWGPRRTEFIRASGASDVVVTKDLFTPLSVIVERGLPPPPVEVSYVAHWLAIDGTQPAIPENMPLERAPRPAAAKAQRAARPAAQAAEPQIGPPAPSAGPGAVVHMVSAELQLYLDRLADVLRAMRSKTLAEQEVSVAETKVEVVAAAVERDPGLQQLLPGLMQTLAGELQETNGLPGHLGALVQVAEALVANQALNLTPYLHRLLPVLMSVALGRLGPAEGDAVPLAAQDWHVRERAAQVVASLASRYAAAPFDVRGRVLAFAAGQACAPRADARTLYGALVVLRAFSPEGFPSAVSQALRETPLVATLARFVGAAEGEAGLQVEEGAQLRTEGGAGAGSGSGRGGAGDAGEGSSGVRERALLARLSRLRCVRMGAHVLGRNLRRKLLSYGDLKARGEDVAALQMLREAQVDVTAMEGRSGHVGAGAEASVGPLDTGDPALLAMLPSPYLCFLQV